MMTDRQINILLIEDNPGDARLIEEMLSEVDGTLFNVENANRLSDGLTRIQKGGIDVVLLDLGLPDSAGLDTFEKVHDQAPEVPIVMLTGLDATELALEGVRMGAQDYLVKGRADGDMLARTLRYAIERKTAEARIKHLNSVLKAIRNVNQLIVTETERDSLLRKSCDALVGARSYDAVWLGSLRADETFDLVVGSGFREDIAHFSDRVAGGDHPPCIRDALSKKERVMVIDETDVCRDCFFKDACLGRAAAIIRVEHADRFFGLLVVSFAPDVVVDEEEKGLLTEVASDIGIALHNSEMAKERKVAVDALAESEERLRMMFENMGNAVAVYVAVDHGNDFIFKGFNRAAEEIEQIQREDLIGKSVLDVFPGVVDFGLFDVFQRVWQTEEPEHFPVSFYKGETIAGWRENYVYKLPSGEIVAIYEDVTEQKAAEEALLESEEKYRSLIDDVLDTSAIGTFILDDEFKVVWINHSTEKYFGLKREDVIGKDKRQLIRDRIKDIFEDPETFKQKVFATYDDNTCIENFECHVLPGEERKEYWLEHWSQPIRSGLYKGGRIEHYSDITERKSVEDALLESERKYSEFFRTSRDPVFITTKEGGLVESNDALMEILGYETMDELLKIVVPEHYENPEDRKRFNRITEQQGFAKEFPANLVKKDGSIINTLLTATVIKDRGGNVTGFQGTIRDITDRKAAADALEESEEKYRVLFETAKDAIFLNDETGKFMDVNSAACESLGYSKEELLKLSNGEIDADPRGYEAFLKVRNGLMKEAVFEVNQQRKDGTIIPVEISGKSFGIGDSKLFLAIARDITERKQAEDQIKRSLQEKEVLLREIHHRVKNNLQVVSSLLNMQARNVKDKKTIEVLFEARDRIKTMSLIHSQLYEGRDLAEINMKGFIDQLLGQLLQSYPIGDTRITHVVRVDDYPLPISVAVPVGLIINELLSNALKHAFEGNAEGKIEVSLTASEDGRINLTVSDDGVGLPPGFDIDTSKTLGLRLVKILTEDQLQGTLEVTSDGGATFRLEFETETG